MEARGPSPSMITVLSLAFSEWVLIFMLFIDGSFGYLITKFAQYCQLQIPCLFCSRLDHVLGNERKGFYWDLLCCNHKLRISSLVLCHHHNNLVDVHGMCESCLFSFETVNKSNSETFKLLVGKIGAETHHLLEDPSLESLSKRNCFCCKEQCVSNGLSRKLVPIKSAGSEADEKGHSKQDSVDPYFHQESRNITIAEDLRLEKLIHPSSVSHLLEGGNFTSNEVSAAYIDNGAIDINPRQSEHGPDMSVPSPYAIGTQSNVPREASAATMTAELEKVMPKMGSDAIPSSEPMLDSKPDTTDTTTQMAPSLDLGDAYKLATSSRVRQLSGKFLKQMSLKDSTQNSEDLKLLLSQFSASRGIDSSLNDDLKASEASTSLVQRRISLERNESNISLDGSTVSEIEGESMVDRLKRQVEHDKIFMNALYKELEEERSASAVAANQAMAMITRLQEEKASLQMEALQCLRMMEEQADFDNEALQNANENSTEMEKMVQELEAELQVYKKKYGNITLLKDMDASCESRKT